MSIHCDYGDFDPSDHETWFYYPNDYTTLKTKRRKRCCSCQNLIEIESICTKIERFRHRTKWEEARSLHYDDGVRIAPWWMCEECSDLMLSLRELGYSFDVGENMKLLVEIYKKNEEE